MPPSEAQALDGSTLAVVLVAVVVMTVLILTPLLWLQLSYLPRLQAEARRSRAASLYGRAHTTPLRVLLGCGVLVLLMLVTSSTLLAVFLHLGTQRRPGHRSIDGVPASINFCEEDFMHSSLIAEPANTISSLIIYPWLAWLSVRAPAPGLRSPPRRFVAGALAILAIGLGSCALHALLIASAQGGDELPILWYVAIAAFISVDLNLDASGSAVAGGAWLSWGFGGGAAVATAVYVNGRDDFTVFIVCLTLFSLILTVSIICLIMVPDWTALRGPAGCVALAGSIVPLAIAVGWCTVLGMWCWVAEMNLCGVVARLQPGGEQGGGERGGGERGGGGSSFLLALLFNRFIHPLWHALSALVAYLVLQLLLAAHGLLRHSEWGLPACSGLVPLVTFMGHDKRA
eukprot:CAMPEP_0119302460 /NCGR_PEP_ID=MMETSP1333-20130426/4044_1 /TAXON_ID=418940 /ORGANISM="Scyphosphaera apsteinii, Strain RCC1455" /LENGTH=400 /DNA_ID=CAMNT_0007304811 /DNA_START=176 /DNA_END=1378 /DNA_ORIENTATION=-